MWQRQWALVILFFALSAGHSKAVAGPSADEIRSAVADHAAAATALFREFLALPNDAGHPADIQALNAWMADAFAERGFRTQLLITAGNAVLYAERLVDGAEKTVLVYLQADGQPVDPSAWDRRAR